MSREIQSGIKKEKFQQGSRLRKKKDFQAVFDEKKKLVLSPLVVYGKSCQKAKLGLVVSKQVGNSPCRNKTKRRLREIFRKSCQKQALEIVVIARKKAAHCSYLELEESFLYAIKRLRTRLRDSNSPS